MGNVDGKEIGNDGEAALGEGFVDLLGGDFFFGFGMDDDGGMNGFGLKLVDGELFGLGGCEDERRRSPVSETLAGDGDAIGDAGRDVAKLEEAAIVGLEGAAIGRFGADEGDGGALHGVVVDVHDGAGDHAELVGSGGGLRSGGKILSAKRQREQKEKDEWGNEQTSGQACH